LEDERRKGHGKLAGELSQLLEKAPPAPALTPLPIPANRSSAPLVQDIPHERLRHHMVLPAAVETRLQRVEKEFAARVRLKKHGYRPKRRILLHGPPGCGKTLGAERLAWNTGLSLRRVRFETLLSSYFGETATNLHRVFDDARRTPCALFLDECDTIASSRVQRHDVGEVPRIVNTLLQLLEEYDGDGLVIAATNLTESLDRALFRRFDEVIEIPPPSVDEIARLLEMSLAAMEKERGISWVAQARALDGHSCSEVVRVAENAAKRCILEGRLRVTATDLESAMGELNHLSLSDHAR
jgi:SpoVK/Ycf46/Vps4 family AAA+-type ATPase